MRAVDRFRNDHLMARKLPLRYSGSIPILFFASSVFAGLSMVIFEGTISPKASSHLLNPKHKLPEDQRGSSAPFSGNLTRALIAGTEDALWARFMGGAGVVLQGVPPQKDGLRSWPSSS